MSVFEQNGFWWYEFTFNGERIRKGSKSRDKGMAKLIEAEHRKSLEEGTGGVSSTYQANNPTVPSKPLPNVTGGAPLAISRAMTLAEAGELWLAQKLWKRRKPKTLECSQGYLKALINFFGAAPLASFHAGSLRVYQAARAKAVGPSESTMS